MTWQDGYGNRHDLDYVLERAVTLRTHWVLRSRLLNQRGADTPNTRENKVQEIEAAGLPIALTFSRHQPFFVERCWPANSRETPLSSLNRKVSRTARFV